MNIPKKYIALAAAVALAVLIVIIIVLSIHRGPVKSGIFTRCDGLNEPIEPISISSCPDPSKDGYCGIWRETEFDLVFTPAKDFTIAMFEPTTVLNSHEYVWQSEVCYPFGTCQCPSKAGEKQHLKGTVRFSNFDGSPDLIPVRLNVFDTSTEDKILLYCVEFPAKFFH